MKMKMKGGVIEDDASIEGLFSCTMKYEIKSTKATIEWNGPKIPLAEWNQVLSFFQWCYDTTKSECQVRLFVSPTLNTWKAYAFPQEAKTGMTAHELDNEEKRRQRAELNLNPPDWYYFGTVHHHCSLGAFQSGTDETNEQDQDGLHITIGKLDNKERYDFHARFYRKGLVLKNENLDMSWFVDTAPVLAECPANFRKYLPKDWADQTARRLLSTPPTTIAFPDIWKENLIEIKPTYTPSSDYRGSSFPGYTNQCPSLYSSETEPLWQRAQSAWKEIVFKCAEKNVEPQDVEAALADLLLVDFAYNIICMACRHHRVDPDDLERQAPVDLEATMAEETLSQQQERNVAPDPKVGASGVKKAGGEAPAGGTGNGEDPDWSQLHNIT